jgi:hypothetical protein
MPKMKFEDLVANWTNLLAAVDEEAQDIPELEAFRRSLADALENVRVAKCVQLTLRIASRQSTRNLAEAVQHGWDEAIRTRAYLRGRLGPRNERLARFGVAPLRKRGPRQNG